MPTAIMTAANGYLKENDLAGQPAKPLKRDGRITFALIDTALASLGVNGAITVKKATRALLYADLAHAADTLAVVYNDGTSAFNGVYSKAGSSGSGSWALTPLALPSSFAQDLSYVLSRVDDVTEAAVSADASRAAAVVASAEAVDARDDAEAARDDAVGAAETAGPAQIFATLAEATAAVGGVSANAVVLILNDEGRDGARTFHRKESGSLVFKRRAYDPPPSGTVVAAMVSDDAEDQQDIADKLGVMRSGKAFSAAYEEGAAEPFPGMFHLTGVVTGEASVRHVDVILRSGSHGYGDHILGYADAGVTQGGTVGYAMSGPGTAPAGVFNRYEDGPGDGLIGSRVGSGPGHGLTGNNASAAAGHGVFGKKQPTNGLPGGPYGIGAALAGENLCDTGKGLDVVTAANNADPISHIMERQNGAGGCTLDTRMLAGGERLSLTVGHRIYVQPGSSSPGAFGVNGREVQIGANITGSDAVHGDIIVNVATGNVASHGSYAVIAGANGDNYGFRSNVTGGTRNWAFFGVGNLGLAGHMLFLADNTFDVGAPGERARNIYGAAGLVNTSDGRFKTWTGGLTDAHIRAAGRIEAELGFYQWTAEIEAKGADVARIHFGAIAQDVIRICVEEGLEAEQVEGERPSFRHAFLCFDEWDDVMEAVEEPQDVWKPVEQRQPTGEVIDRIDPKTGQSYQDMVMETVTVERKFVEMVKVGQRVRRAAGAAYGLRLDQLNLFLRSAAGVREQAFQAEVLARLAALEARG